MQANESQVVDTESDDGVKYFEAQKASKLLEEHIVSHIH